VFRLRCVLRRMRVPRAADANGQSETGIWRARLASSNRSADKL
jgi:hypothetical protein